VPDEFLINDARLNTIAETFDISLDSVKQLHEEFTPLENQLKDHHLAHMSRVLENYFKEKTGNSEFFIEYIPYGYNSPKRRGSSAIYRKWLNEFTIYYDNTCSQRDIRVNISHELGHLYLLAKYYNSNTKELNPKYEQTTEPLSSIFGLFIVSNKNSFYANLDSSGHKHDKWEDILDDFRKFSS
jgi:hypothetical protein